MRKLTESEKNNRSKLTPVQRGTIERVIAVRDKYFKGRKASGSFAKALGLSPSTIYKWETYLACPSRVVLNTIIDTFKEINPDWLLSGKGLMDKGLEVEIPTTKIRRKDAVGILEAELKQRDVKINMLEDKVVSQQEYIALQQEYIDALKKIANIN